MTKKLAESYKKAYGFWEVTTEGDCEGKSVSRLGIYEGYIDEIALALADRCYYSLCFRPIDPRALDLTHRFHQKHGRRKRDKWKFLELA